MSVESRSGVEPLTLRFHLSEVTELPYPCSCTPSLCLVWSYSLCSDLCGLPPNAFLLLTLRRNPQRGLRFTFGDHPHVGRCASSLWVCMVRTCARECLSVCQRTTLWGCLIRGATSVYPIPQSLRDSYPVGVLVITSVWHYNSVELLRKDRFNSRSIPSVFFIRTQTFS